MANEKPPENLSRRDFFQRLGTAVREVGPFGSSDPSPEEKAIEALEEKDVAVLQLSLKENRLQVHCKQVTDEFGDEEMELLRPLTTQISWLDLGNTDITDEGLQIVREMSYLKRLYLQNTKVTDEGLSILEKLNQLEYLNLYGTNITDEGLERVLACERLKTLYLWHTEVTEEGVEELRERMPEVEITFGSSHFDSPDQTNVL